MEEAITPIQPTPARSTEIQKIEQYSNGRVRLSFARNSIDLGQASRSRQENQPILLPFENFSSTSNSFRRYYQTPTRASISFDPNFHSTRALISSIPTTTRTNLRGVDNTSNIPRPIYTANQDIEISPPMLPTYSSMIDNPNFIQQQNKESEIHMLQKSFYINKEQCNKEFFSDKNKKKRKQFWNNYSKQKTEIQEEYYKFLNQHEIHITFFDWFEEYYQDNKIQTINMAKNNNQWQTSQGILIESKIGRAHV